MDPQEVFGTLSIIGKLGMTIKSLEAQVAELTKRLEEKDGSSDSA